MVAAAPRARLPYRCRNVDGVNPLQVERPDGRQHGSARFEVYLPRAEEAA